MGADLVLRVERLEADMVAVKQHQFEHECQIDTLALEVHTLVDKVDRLEMKIDQQMVTKKEFKKELDYRFGKVDARFEKIESTLKLICNALAI